MKHIIQYKVTIWREMEIDLKSTDLENIQKLIKNNGSIEDIYDQYGAVISSDSIIDQTDELLSPEENNDCSTIELSVDGVDIICSNSQLEFELELIDKSIVDDYVELQHHTNKEDKITSDTKLGLYAVYNINIFKSIKEGCTAIIHYKLEDINQQPTAEDIIDYALSINAIDKDDTSYITSVEKRF